MEVLYIKDLQKELSVSRDTVTRLIKRGEIKTFKIGGRTATTREFLTDYINKQIMEAEKCRNS